MAAANNAPDPSPTVRSASSLMDLGAWVPDAFVSFRERGMRAGFPAAASWWQGRCWRGILFSLLCPGMCAAVSGSFNAGGEILYRRGPAGVVPGGVVRELQKLTVPMLGLGVKAGRSGGKPRRRRRPAADLGVEGSGALLRPTSYKGERSAACGGRFLRTTTARCIGASPSRGCPSGGCSGVDGGRWRVVVFWPGASRDLAVFLFFVRGLCAKCRHSCASGVLVRVWTCLYCCFFLI